MIDTLSNIPDMYISLQLFHELLGLMYSYNTLPFSYTVYNTPLFAS